MKSFLHLSSCEERVLSSKKGAYKEPRYALFGLVKKQGEYRVELARVKRKETCGTKNKDGYIEIVSGKAVVADPVEVGQVLPFYVIHGDVCPETGNVYFNGDVHIKGSVMDNMKVVVDGDITVTGNVLQAILIAGGSVTIRGNIISSSITAGAEMVNSLCVMPKIKEILNNIKKDFYDTQLCKPAEMSWFWAGAHIKLM